MSAGENCEDVSRKGEENKEGEIGTGA